MVNALVFVQVLPKKYLHNISSLVVVGAVLLVDNPSLLYGQLNFLKEGERKEAVQQTPNGPKEWVCLQSKGLRRRRPQ